MIKFQSTVKKVERKRRTVRGYMEGGEAKLDTEDLGWFLLLEGSWEYLHVGREKPDFEVGQRVVVTIERV